MPGKVKQIFKEHVMRLMTLFVVLLSYLSVFLVPVQATEEGFQVFTSADATPILDQDVMEVSAPHDQAGESGDLLELNDDFLNDFDCSALEELETESAQLSLGDSLRLALVLLRIKMRGIRDVIGEQVVGLKDSGKDMLTVVQQKLHKAGEHVYDHKVPYAVGATVVGASIVLLILYKKRSHVGTTTA